MHSKKISNNETNCFICNQLSDSTTTYNDIGWSDFGIFNKLKIKYCIHCGFGHSFPEIDVKVINHFYEKQYRSKESTFYINFSKLKDTKVSGVADIRDSRSFGQLSLARAFTKTKNFRLIRKVKVLNSLPQLSYGENRDCIRMVIRNKI